MLEVVWAALSCDPADLQEIPLLSLSVPARDATGNYLPCMSDMQHRGAG